MSPTSLPQMRFLCFGVGAIGTYIGGSLALIGQRVVFVDNPGVAAQVRGSGLHLCLDGHDRIVQDPIIVTSMNEALTQGPFDLAILAIKSYDTASFVDNLQAYSAALPPFLCLQNGVENEDLLAKILGGERVIPASVTTAIARLAAGNIVLERLRGIGIASGHPLSATLAALFDSAGLRARLYNQPMAMKWSKMLTNLMGNATSAILNMTPAQVYADPQLYALEVQQLIETLRVMRAQRIPVVDLPGTPVRALALALNLLPAGLSRPFVKRAIGKGRGEKMPSFHIDLYAGRPQSEVGYLNGAVVRYGQRFAVPTPANSFLNETLLSLVEGKTDKSEFANQPKKLIELYQDRVV
ncbi:MAG: 2-dehydropantoate 2-reductase [Anaerolineaceae bacterium]|nr:2-dehydropantoate 2-reductase [Anaerolineaceae bacterium]